MTTTIATNKQLIDIAMNLKTMKIFLSAIGAIFIVTSAVFAAYQRIAHPEWTETQLFLNDWSIYIAVPLAGIGFMRLAQQIED